MSQKKVQQKKKQRQREREAVKRRKQRIKRVMLVTVAVVLVAVIGVSWIQGASNSGSGNTPGSETSQATQRTADEPVDFNYDQQPRLGDPKAPVKVVEFGDYKCPTCQKFDTDIFPSLRSDFVETGKVAFYFINDTIIAQDSITASQAAEAVYNQNQDLFWKYHEALYDNQGAENQTWATPQFLVNLAKEKVPDIDANQLKKDIENETYADDVTADTQKAQQAGVQGTPTLFINGKMVDVQTTFNYAALKDAINKAYQKAAK